jgi:hypothetical protein
VTNLLLSRRGILDLRFCPGLVGVAPLAILGGPGWRSRDGGSRLRCSLRGTGPDRRRRWHVCGTYGEASSRPPLTTAGCQYSFEDRSAGAGAMQLCWRGSKCLVTMLESEREREK